MTKKYPDPKPPIIIGSFEDMEKKLAKGEITQDQYQKYFEESRYHGLDGSLEYAIGGSTAPKVLGVSQYGGPAGVASDLFKTTKFNALRDDDSPLVAGHIFEGAVREYFAYNHPELTVKPCYLQAVNPNWPHCLANVDGVVFEKDPKTGKRNMGLYEGKLLIAPSGPHALAFKQGIVPDDYMVQIQFYMEVWNLDFTWIVAARSFLDQTAIRVERDRDFGAYICSKCEELINKGKFGTMPSNSDVENIKARIADNRKLYPYGDSALPPAKISKKFVSTLRKTDSIREDIKTIEDEIAVIADSIKDKTDEIAEKEKQISAQEKKIAELIQPIADELGNNTKGVLTDEDDGTQWEINFPESSGFSTKKAVMKRFAEDLEDKYGETAKDAIITMLSSYEPKPRKLSYNKLESKRV